MALKSIKTTTARNLTETAEEMVARAKGLMKQAEAVDLPEDQRQQLRNDADQWLDKAIKIAQSVRQLARE